MFPWKTLFHSRWWDELSLKWVFRFFRTLFLENLAREECHTILVWKEKWEEIRQKSVKDWKINEAENPMVWMQEISLLCHPSVNGSSLSFFQISHLLWAQPKCYEKLQISRKLHMIGCWSWLFIVVVDLPKNQALNFIVCVPVMFWFFFLLPAVLSLVFPVLLCLRSKLLFHWNGSTNDVSETFLNARSRSVLTSRFTLRYIT